MRVRFLLLMAAALLLTECGSIGDNSSFIKGDVTCSEYSEYSSSDTNCIVIYNHTGSTLYGHAVEECFTINSTSTSSTPYKYLGSVDSTNRVLLSTSSIVSSPMTLGLDQNQGVGVHGLDTSVQESGSSDSTAPSGSVTINNNDTSTTSLAVTLNLAATDSQGVTAYYASSSSGTPAVCDSGWVANFASTSSFSNNAAHTLSDCTGNAVYAWFKDRVGNISSQASDSIQYTDSTGPSGSVQINNGASSTTSTSVTLNLSATDTCGVTSYYASESSSTPSANASGWVSVTSTSSYSADVSFTLSSGAGTKYVYVWYKDAAGNLSSSASDSISSTSTETETGQGSTTGGIVYLYFSIPSGTSSVKMTVQLAGDFSSSYEYASVYFNGYSLGTVSSGYDGYTLVTPSGWSSKSVSSSYWTAGSTTTVKFDATSYVNYNPGRGYYYKYKVTLTYQ